MPRPGSPLTIYLLDEGEDVERLTGRENIQGLYSPSSEGSYLIASRAPGYYKERLSGQRVLFHEYTHHFMYRHFNSAWPVWYREGFAEYAERVHIRCRLDRESGPTQLAAPQISRRQADAFGNDPDGVGRRFQT